MTSPVLSHADHILAACMPGKAGLYFVGPFTSRITFYSQQVRALQLAHAIDAERLIKANENVAVVGAGAAGITIAVALALLGCQVTLYDRAKEVLPLQSASQRLLHPHIYEWPRLGSLDERAGLPFLDWSAGPGETVVKALRGEFAGIDAGLANLIVKTGHELNEITQEGSEWRLAFETADGSITRSVEHAVLSMGFGDERSCGALKPEDYWRPGAIGTTSSESSAVAAVPYVVSGNGDGALTVALGLLIKDFEHASFTRTFLSYFSRDQLRQAADKVFAGKNLEDDVEAEFRLHLLPVLQKYSAIDRLRTRLRSDRSLTLNSSGPLFAAGKASQLNQCMVLALIEAAYAQGVKVVRSEGHVSDCTETQAGITLTGTHINGRPDATAYKHAILRHGPDQTKRYQATGSLIALYQAHYASLRTSIPALAIPPALDDKTYNLFEDARIARLAPPGMQAQQQRLAAQLERRVVEISIDPASHVLVERGCERLVNIVAQCEQLPLRYSIDLYVSPGQVVGSHDLARLARCSDGKIELRAASDVRTSWRALLNGITEAPAPSSMRAVGELGQEDFAQYVDACLVRLLDQKIEAAITSGTASPLGTISRQILAHVATTWAEWRSTLESNPELRFDFLRWLANVDQQTSKPWDGAHGAVSDMANGLILMAATHAGETLVPRSIDTGNLEFAAKAVAIGTGCRAIGMRPLSSRTAPEDWGVDALILSAVPDVIVSDAAGTVLDGGFPGNSITTARRVPPAIIQADVKWLACLGTSLAEWRMEVKAEFDMWRRRQDEEIARVSG